MQNFILGVMVGGVIVGLVMMRKQQPDTKGESLLEKQAREKEEHKQRILGILETQTPLTNDHVEQLLGISDATATRYLQELEKEGRIRQVGKTGQSVYYEKI